MRTKKYYKLIRVDYEDTQYLRIKNISGETGVFKLVKRGSPTMPNLEYSVDGVTWTSYDTTNLPEIQVVTGGNIYLRGTNNSGFNRDSSNYVSLNFNKTCEAYGNMCSLLNSDPAVFSAMTTIDYSYSLSRVFYGCTSLTTPPDLGNVTSVGNYVFSDSFNGCTSLTTPPDLSGLTSVGQSGLYSTFYGCTSLTTPPDLSGLTSVRTSGLSRTFYGCTSLTTGPDLRSVTSVGDYGFDNTFQNCSKLGNVTAPNISDLTTKNVINGWLFNAGALATGTKVVNVPTGATIATNSNSGIPSGWTRVDY